MSKHGQGSDSEPATPDLKGDYDVGYRRPPRHSRWRPGQSGNPKGRPKGARNLRTEIQAVLGEMVQVKRGGKVIRVSAQMAALLRLLEKALNGDIRALNVFLALAQRYNDDEPLAPADELAAGDEEILARFAHSLLQDVEPPARATPKKRARRSAKGRKRANRSADAPEAGASP
jgi:hypothetical protein